VTDEELEAIKLESPCPSCDGTMASVRHASNRWWYVGCTCFNKYKCERDFVLECVEKWNTQVRRYKSLKER
jgi:ssDNA-binding Zn-finger/Zn-ribbon topoisomerase 1